MGTFGSLHLRAEKLFEDGNKFFQGKTKDRRRKIRLIHPAYNLLEGFVGESGKVPGALRSFFKERVRDEPGIRACPRHPFWDLITTGKYSENAGFNKPAFLAGFEEKELEEG
jgi:hypothetical protein